MVKMSLVAAIAIYNRGRDNDKQFKIGVKPTIFTEGYIKYNSDYNKRGVKKV